MRKPSFRINPYSLSVIERIEPVEQLRLSRVQSVEQAQLCLSALKTMVQDRLTKAVARRLQELGLPLSLIDVDEFREHFFLRRWVMFVRDDDKIADVHLIEPQQHVNSLSRRNN